MDIFSVRSTNQLCNSTKGHMYWRSGINNEPGRIGVQTDGGHSAVVPCHGTCIRSGAWNTAINGFRMASGTCFLQNYDPARDLYRMEALPIVRIIVSQVGNRDTIAAK